MHDSLSTKMILSFTALAGLLSALAPSIAAAQAQTAPHLSVMERPRQGVNPLGKRAGAFIISPSVDVKGSYSDNIYATNGNEQSDQVLVTAPSVAIVSDWNRHHLAVSATGIIGRHQDVDSEDYEDIVVGANGTLDINEGNNLNGSISYAQLHESRGNPNDVNGLTPTEYNQLKGAVWYQREVGRVGAMVKAQATRNSYDDIRAASGALITNSDRDHDEMAVSTRVSYEVMPGYDAFVEGGLNWRNYDKASFAAKDSNGFHVATGAAVEITGAVKGELAVGYLEQNYDNDALYDPIESVALSGGLLWLPTKLTSVGLDISQEVVESAALNSSGYLSTGVNATLEHEVKRNVVLFGGAGYQLDQFESGSNAGREDDVLSARAGAKWWVRRGVAIGGQWAVEDRDSSLDTEDHTINSVNVNLGLAY